MSLSALLQYELHKSEFCSQAHAHRLSVGEKKSTTNTTAHFGCEMRDSMCEM